MTRKLSVLTVTAELRDWTFPTSYLAQGKVYGHPIWDEGHQLNCIQVASISEFGDHWIVKTVAGTVYKLLKATELK